MRYLKAALLVMLVGTVALGSGARAAAPLPRADWILLGQRLVSDRADHDIIPVTGVKGLFHKIKLMVGRASVDFHRVVVHFGNGGDQEITLRNTIPAGGESRSIDLDGADRVIRSVEFWYDANTIRGRKAVVQLYGSR